MLDPKTIVAQFVKDIMPYLTGAPTSVGGLDVGSFFTQDNSVKPVAHATYPAYAPPASDAYQNAAGGHELINTNLLSTAEQAILLNIELGGSGQIQVVNDPNVVYGPSGRKQYLVIINGRSINVGMAWQDHGRAGVGAPGSWDLTEGAPHIWKLVDNTVYPW